MECWTLLPHYSIRNGKLLFLNSVEVAINFTNELLMCIRINGFIKKGELEKQESRIAFEALKNRGILYCVCDSKEKKESLQDYSLIIQPHCDDFVFSCGATIAKEQSINQHLQSDVITVFSEYAFINCPWNNQANINDGDYSKLRIIENELCGNELNLHFYYLGLEDAGRRSRSTESLFCNNRLSRNDQDMVKTIQMKLEEIFKERNIPEKVYIPSAVGWHRDHLIVHNAVTQWLRARQYKGQIYMYEDYPYCDNGRYWYWERIHQLQEMYNMKPIYHNVEEVIHKKVSLYNYFRSQFKESSIQEIRKNIIQLSVSTGYEGRAMGDLELLKENSMYERVWSLSYE